MSEFRVATKASAIEPGKGVSVCLSEKKIAVFNVNGTFYAIDDTCAHRGGPLGEGDLEGSTVTCPWHGWQYDVTSGACKTSPSVRVSCFPIKVEEDEVKVLC